MLKRIFLAILACTMFAASGCDTVKPYWKSTKKMYKEYVNVDPNVDLTNTGNSDPSLIKLAEMFTPVDERLEFLLRALSAQDLPPSQEWCQAFMDSFPWLSGVAVVTNSGNVSFKLPMFTLKSVDYAPLLEFENLYKNRKMAAYVAASELGAEIMVGKPLFVDNEYRGLLVATFDPGNLTKFSPEPGKLMLFVPGSVLWSGDDSASAQALAQLNWKNLLKSDVAGEQTVGGTRYLWQSRYLAQIRLIYAVSAVTAPAKAEKSEPKPVAAPTPAP